jgi:alpha-D-ribose 1-methylphosphonate 5-phosphate C-P lyase
VIDQGSDETTNAVNIRRFFARTTGVATTTRTVDATIIQTRHRIPEAPLTDKQILVYQVPMPEPLLSTRTARRPNASKLHALADYGLISVKLYEDIVHHGSIATTYDYPGARQPSLPRFALADSEVRQPEDAHEPRAAIVRRGPRDGASHAIPPYTPVRSLDFDDHPFEVQKWQHACALCGSTESFLDEMIVDDAGQTHVRLLRLATTATNAAATRISICRHAKHAKESPHDAASERPRAHQTLRRPQRAAETSASICIPAKCCALSANPARARPHCSTRSRSKPRPTAVRFTARPRMATSSICSRLSEPRRACSMRTEWGFVQQNPRDGLRSGVSAGANIGEPLMAVGARHYGDIRYAASAVDGARRTRRFAYRRISRCVFGRHAAAPADRAQSRHQSAARVHGRTHRRSRRVGAGAPARSAAHAHDPRCICPC